MSSPPWRDELFRQALLWLALNRRKVLGATLGLVVGILVVRYGVVKAAVIAGSSLVGYLLGARMDQGDDLRRVWRRWFSD